MSSLSAHTEKTFAPARVALARRPLIAALITCWLGTLAAGWYALLDHTYQPSMPGEPVECWPSGRSFCKGDPHDFRIIVFAHPFCPCTRATLLNVEESLTRLPDDVSLSVIFVTAGFDEDEVARSSLIAQARQLPGVTVEEDLTGTIADEFHARISGEVFAFDRSGRRCFHGGLTAGRGHLGYSSGQQWLEKLASRKSEQSYSGPVFGCDLPRSPAQLGPHAKSTIRASQSRSATRAWPTGAAL